MRSLWVCREPGPWSKLFCRPIGPLFRRRALAQPPGPALAYLVAHLLLLAPGAFGVRFARKARSPLTYQHHMRQFLHHPASDRDRMAIATQGTHRASAQGLAIHDAGIQFRLAKQIGPSVQPNAVYLWRSLNQTNAHFHGIQGRAA